MRCDFCEHRCNLSPGQTGRCGVRRRDASAGMPDAPAATDGIRTVNYGDVVSLAIDPIEKKPLYHVFPGASALSVALFGCNFRCDFCQNWSISQPEYRDRHAYRTAGPDDIVARMADAFDPDATRVVAFTYSEPTVWQDYMIDCSTAVHDAGGLTAMVTNGFFTEEALSRILPVIDAFNIDCKGGDEFYRRLCGGRLEPVLRNIRSIAAAESAILEVTTMLLEGVHSVDEIVGLGHELADAGVAVWHLSRFHPAHGMQDHRPTRSGFLDDVCRRIDAEISIPHVYAFGGSEDRREKTWCPSCGALCVDRDRFAATRNLMDHGRCPSCAGPVYGLFSR
ncbi:MAG: radical SAM protein [Spirochaetaceae bacterium]|nr:MAG: radical SAM protein [Spirochaetaceae bacterium]